MQDVDDDEIGAHRRRLVANRLHYVGPLRR
jgi:hypothetical protein